MCVIATMVTKQPLIAQGKRLIRVVSDAEESYLKN